MRSPGVVRRSPTALAFCIAIEGVLWTMGDNGSDIKS
jgi:hypothetical protein